MLNPHFVNPMIPTEIIPPPYLTQHVLTNPTVEQMRCATQIISRRKVDGVREATVLYSASVERQLREEVY